MMDESPKLRSRLTDSPNVRRRLTDSPRFAAADSPARDRLGVINLDAYRLQMLDEYEELLDDQESSDFVIVAGGKPIYAHSHILACKSRVLARLIRESAQLIIDDLEHQALREMLRFLYAGKVDGLECHAKQLLAVANRYEIGPLVAVCEETLSRALSPDNAYEYLKLADLRKSERLKEKAIGYIVSHSKDMKIERIIEADLRKELLVDLVKAYNDAYEALTRNVTMVLSPSRSLSGRELDYARRPN